ncbi:SDR family oxidoreductase [Chloroflexota bacterium]
MSSESKVAITGAFGYTGKYIARQLLAQGKQIITLTGHPDRPNEFADRIQAYPFNFDQPVKLTKSLSGVDTLYNTYWVRFNHGLTTFKQAVQNTKTLIQAAKQAGVRRLVHVSITNPTAASPLPYFSGKAELEDTITTSGLSYAIIRPTVIFGREDILINNIAFLLRKFPIFVIPGDGKYRLQPIYIEDMVKICIQAGQVNENLVLDAVGPDIFVFNELVGLIASKIQSRSRVIHLPPLVPLLISQFLGLWLRDIVLTRDEYKGLSANLLISGQQPRGQTRLADWLEQNNSWVGKNYASELGRHYTTLPAQSK